jgi:hypothetical protein
LLGERETIYGGVKDWSCDDEELRILLTTDAAEVFGASVYRIRLSDPANLATVRDRLQAILAP